ncbi:hypothetical protein Taro_022543 [Colocasia esculenta]|uniref:Uncharacterized protein n=1 Tax=Colocasia esculenta TaxID=4460 RepID=A0A843V8P3_COLES|nr:hypothetical protein [Colocasia esculenta]
MVKHQFLVVWLACASIVPTPRTIWVRSSGVGGHCSACRDVFHVHAIAWFWVTLYEALVWPYRRCLVWNSLCGEVVVLTTGKSWYDLVVPWHLLLFSDRIGQSCSDRDVLWVAFYVGVKATRQLSRSPKSPACVTRGLKAVSLAGDLSELLRRRRGRHRVLVEDAIGWEAFPPSSSGGLGVVESLASSWRSSGATWSEEEAAEASHRPVRGRQTRIKYVIGLTGLAEAFHHRILVAFRYWVATISLSPSCFCAVRRRHLVHRDLFVDRLAVAFLLRRRCTYGHVLVASFMFCLVVFRVLGPCRVTSQLCHFCGGCPASSLSPGARHLRACPRDRLLPFPETPSPVRLCQRVLLLAAGTRPVWTSWSVSLPRSALVLEPRGEVRRGAVVRRDCDVCGCVHGCDSLASLYRGGYRQESAAGVQEGWTIGFLVVLVYNDGCSLAMSSSVGLVGLASWALFSGFHSAGSLRVPGAGTQLLFW